MMRVALYFGSFDPLHNGHMALVGYTLAFTPHEQLWLVLSPQSPFKKEKDLTREGDRCAFIQRALDHYGDSRVKLCTDELSLPRPSYSINTLDYFSAKYPDAQFSLLMGADNFQSITRWREWERLLFSYPIYVYPRHGYSLSLDALAELPQTSEVHLMGAPRVEMSSSFIREVQDKGYSVDFFLPVSSRASE